MLHTDLIGGGDCSDAVMHFRGVSRSNGHRSPLQSLDRIAELAQTLAPPLEDATDAGLAVRFGGAYGGGVQP